MRGTTRAAALLVTAGALQVTGVLLPVVTLGGVVLAAYLLVRACGHDGVGVPSPPAAVPEVLAPPDDSMRQLRLSRVVAMARLLPPWAVADPDRLSALASQVPMRGPASVDDLAVQIREALGHDH